MGLRINGKETARAVKILNESFKGTGFRSFDVNVANFHPFTLKFKLFDFSKKDVAQFTLTEQPNCCGILISTKTYVYTNYRGMGIAQQLMELKIALAKEFGYSLLLATTKEENKPEIHILEKFGWKCIKQFVNKRTEHSLRIYTLNLE